MAFEIGLEIDELADVELAEGSFISASSFIFSPVSIEVDELAEVELSPSTFVAQAFSIFSLQSIDLDSLVEMDFGIYQNFFNQAIPVFNESSGVSIELLLFALPPVGLLGSTFSQGLELVMEASDTVFLTVEDILDILDYDGDIRLILDEGEGKLNIKQNDLERDAGLETAVLISLFTDQRGTPDDLTKDGLNDLRGWWGDQFAEVDGDQTGSFLWLLERAKIDQEALSRAQDYAKKALKWTVDDGVVKDITCTVSRYELEGILIAIGATRPKADEKVTFKYFYNWKAQELRRVP